MTRPFAVRRSRPLKPSRRRRRIIASDALSPSRQLCPRFEQLEHRVMLTVAQDLINALTPYQTALTNALNAAARLPLVGTQFNTVSDLKAIFQKPDTETQIDD